MESREIKLEERIMSEIKDKKIRIKSKYVFLAEKLGLGSGLVLSVILAVFFLNLGLFYVKSAGYLGYLNLGGSGLLAFLEALPYLWIIIFILFFILASFILKQYDISYKKHFGYLSLGMFVFIIFSGSIFAMSNINKKFEQKAFEGNSYILRQLYGRGSGPMQFGAFGRIESINEKGMVIMTPHGKRMILFEENKNFRPGDFIMASGFESNNGFEAKSVKLIDREHLFRIRHEIERRQLNHNFIPGRLLLNEIKAEL